MVSIGYTLIEPDAMVVVSVCAPIAMGAVMSSWKSLYFASLTIHVEPVLVFPSLD